MFPKPMMYVVFIVLAVITAVLSVVNFAGNDSREGWVYLVFTVMFVVVAFIRRRR